MSLDNYRKACYNSANAKELHSFFIFYRRVQHICFCSIKPIIICTGQQKFSKKNLLTYAIAIGIFFYICSYDESNSPTAQQPNSPTAQPACRTGRQPNSWGGFHQSVYSLLLPPSLWEGRDRLSANYYWLRLWADSKSLSKKMKVAGNILHTRHGTPSGTIRPPAGTIRTRMRAVRTPLAIIRTRMRAVRTPSGTIRTRMRAVRTPSGTIRTGMRAIRTPSGTIRTHVRIKKTSILNQKSILIH